LDDPQGSNANCGGQDSAACGHWYASDRYGLLIMVGCVGGDFSQTALRVASCAGSLSCLPHISGVTNYCNGPQWAATDCNGYRLCLITATVQVSLLYNAVNRKVIFISVVQVYIAILLSVT